MAIKRSKRTRSEKANAHHTFLVSWQPTETSVKGELKNAQSNNFKKLKPAKKADILAQASKDQAIKKDIFKSLILISLILILELVIYLAKNRFIF